MYSQKDYKLDLDSVHNDFARKILTAKIKKRHQEHLADNYVVEDLKSLLNAHNTWQMPFCQ